MTQWQSMRYTEGKALKDDFDQRIIKLTDLIDSVESLSTSGSKDFHKN